MHNNPCMSSVVVHSPFAACLLTSLATCNGHVSLKAPDMFRHVFQDDEPWTKLQASTFLSSFHQHGNDFEKVRQFKDPQLQQSSGIAVTAMAGRSQEHPASQQAISNGM